MNKEQFKAKIVEALKSGKYPKTHGRLRILGCYCALGVICEVARLEKVVNLEWELVDGSGVFKATTPYDDTTSALPWDIAHLLNCDGDPVLYYKNKPYTVSNLNDRVRLSLFEIGELIEEQL